MTQLVLNWRQLLLATNLQSGTDEQLQGLSKLLTVLNALQYILITFFTSRIPRINDNLKETHCANTLAPYINVQVGQDLACFH